MTTKTEEYAEAYGKEPMKQTVQPIGENILIRRDNAEEKSRGGILIPETDRPKPTRGKVIAVGNGRRSEDGVIVPSQVKVGDRVAFTLHGHTDICIEGTELLLVKETNIFCVIEGDE